MCRKSFLNRCGAGYQIKILGLEMRTYDTCSKKVSSDDNLDSAVIIYIC
jgi:hypothetical protein